MRVLIFLPCLTLGGAERQGHELGRYLRQQGDAVEFWGFPPPASAGSLIPELKADRLPYHQIPAWPRLDWSFADAGFSLQYLRRRRWWNERVEALVEGLPLRGFDVVIPFTFWPSLVACLARDRFNARLCLWNHRGGYDDAGVRQNDFVRRLVRRQRPQFVANSRAGARYLTDTYHLAANSVPVIPNACTVPIRPRSAQGHGDSQTGLTLLHVANLFPEKDYATLLRGLRLLADRGVTCHLHFCGAFVDADQQRRFTDMVGELAIGDRVVFHGARPRHEALALMASADIGLLSSTSEGQPNAVMEYMASGLPVIATRIPGIAEVVGPENDPWLFSVGDASAFAQLVEQLAGQPEERERLGKQNQQRIRDHFSAERVLPQWRSLIALA